MEGYLKVTPEKLISASEEFASSATQMNSLTQEMLGLVQNLKGIWQGEASMSYGNKFASLETDMDKLYRMVMEHSTDLGQMARGYAEAESINTEKGAGMRNNVVV